MESISGFIGGLIYGEGHQVPPVEIGGFIFSKPITGFNNVGIIGGYLDCESNEISAQIGGYLLSLSFGDPSGLIGGLASGLFEPGDAEIGGYILAHPDCKDFAESHARTLVKVRSKDVVDQDLDIDCVVIFKGISNKDFNARFIWLARSFAEFNARFKVEKYKRPPIVEILSVSPSGGVPGSGCIKVTVVASGTLVDGQEWINAQLDFGEPFEETNPRTFTHNMSISGFNSPPPWTAYHDYCVSGKYIITARGQDNLGMVGMDAFNLNLASGLNEDIMPKISISGQPRMGAVPNALRVDFTTQSIGITSPPATIAQSGQSLVSSPSDRRILWSFGNRETSQKQNPFTFYQSPGSYVSVLRYLYTHPSGYKIWVSDSLKIGFLR